jgi:inhibitor of cysteine peptidase
MGQIQLTDVDADTTISAAVSDEIELRLSENPTTGFTWRPGEFDQSMLTLGSDEFIPSGDDPGSGGVHAFRFIVTAVGSSDLSLNLSRSSHGSPAQQFHVTILADA